jgi:hypothetical protein
MAAREAMSFQNLLSTADSLGHAWALISLLLAVVIICILAIREGYQVSISLFGGFRFEPARASQIAPRVAEGESPKAFRE